jgi:Na+-transporting methylmalonyl-CoA/oxaloacetate decarboxylase beta subunit
METIGKIVAVMLTLTVGALVQGYTMHCLWAWFVVPLGVVPLGIAHAFGIAMIVRYMEPSNTSKESSKGSVLSQIGSSALNLAIKSGGLKEGK